jgi:hypothetical protein
VLRSDAHQLWPAKEFAELPEVVALGMLRLGAKARFCEDIRGKIAYRLLQVHKALPGHDDTEEQQPSRPISRVLCLPALGGER